jgi:hypothetical protein
MHSRPDRRGTSGGSIICLSLWCPFWSRPFKKTLAECVHTLLLITLSPAHPPLPRAWASLCPSACRMIISSSKHTHSYQPAFGTILLCSASGMKATSFIEFGKNRFPWCIHLDSIFVQSYGMFHPYIWQPTKMRYCRNTPNLSSKMMLYFSSWEIDRAMMVSEVFSPYYTNIQ